MIEQICVDMDGVLTDFVTHALRLFTDKPQEVIDRWPPGEFEIFQVLGLTEDEGWARISAEGSAYWADMPAYPWHRELLDKCMSIAPTIVLTSPSKSPSSVKGKLMWLQKHYGSRFRNFLIGPKKEFCAKPTAVLIDDSDKNCEKFTAAGGQTILFPHLWNSRHAEAARVPAIEVVRLELEQLAWN